MLPLATFGAAPMFFYLVHLYLLKALYLVALGVLGANHDAVFGVGGVAAVWGIAFSVALALWAPTRAFARLKAKRRSWTWLRYL